MRITRGYLHISCFIASGRFPSTGLLGRARTQCSLDEKLTIYLTEKQSETAISLRWEAKMKPVGEMFLDAGKRQRTDEALAAPFLEIRIGCL